MSRPPLWAFARPLVDHATLQPDLWRAVRATIGFMPPLILAALGQISLDLSLVAIAAQHVAMLDVRGDYRLRVALLLAMAAVFCAAAAIGATVGHNLTSAVLATGLMAVLGGVWRHLSSDYGPPLAISSSLVFFLALATPAAPSHVGTLAFAALAGGVWGVVVQVAGWPFRPQHPLRRTVADSWLAVADLCEALLPVDLASTARRDQLIAHEAALRSTLDHTYATLEAARPGPLRDRLEAVNLASARLGTRVVALNTALEAPLPAASFGPLVTTLEPALTSLANLARSAALTVVSRQPSHLAALEVRLRRLASLLGVLRAKLAYDSAHAQLAAIVRLIEATLVETHAAVRATVERAEERSAVPLELRDLRTLALRPLASALNLTLDFDSTLLRFTLRLAAFTMMGTAVFKVLGLPHGYWLPFTIVVVLQPDYGSTRQRAGERVLGTLGGSLVASALLFLELPVAALLSATAAGVFGFAYFLKRHYAVAIFFVTVFIVLITEAREPVTLAFAVERLASTLAGGALALLAAFLFWPVWERDRLPPILARMFHANRDYLQLLIARLTAGAGFDAEGRLAKRRAEAANSAAFSSLRRLSGDPKNRREGLEDTATLVNGNQRLTRVLNLVTLHLKTGEPLADEAIARFGQLATDALTRLAQAAEHGPPAPGEIEPLLRALEGELFSREPGSERERWVADQLGRAATELSALLLALQNAAPAWSDESTVLQDAT